MKKRTDNQETLVAFVLDKSGSMQTVAKETRSGFNEYVQSLEKDDGMYRFSLTTFDTSVDRVHTNIRPSEVIELDEVNYRPDGMTALYDAAMKTIRSVEDKLTPGQKALVVIMTDGQENSSREYTSRQFADKVKALQDRGNWTFVFMGSNQDAWNTAQAFGFNAGNVATYAASGTGASAAFHTMSANTRSFAASASANTAQFFSEEDKDKLANA